MAYIKSKVKPKTSMKIFPFAPGIAWELAYGKYVIPKISLTQWQRYVSRRESVVLSFGGLIESFFSLSFLEVLHCLDPSAPLNWDGDEKFKLLLKIHGLGKYFGRFDVKNLKRFTTPLFMDRYKYVFFNSLYNYIDVFSYYGEWGYRDSKNLCSQIFRNSLIDWNCRYIPQLRNLELDAKWETWCKTQHFNSNKPWIVVIPEKTGWSQHSVSCLNWTPSQVKALGALLNRHGVTTIVLTPNPGRYYDYATVVPPWDMRYVLFLLSNSKLILSEEIDFLLLGMLCSSAIICSKPTKKQYKLSLNQKFLQTKNQIYEQVDLVPGQVIKLLGY